MSKERRCTVCGEQIPSETIRRLTCSVECGEKRMQQQLREYVAARTEERSKKAGDRLYTCKVCGTQFKSIYRNAAYCKPECRTIGTEIVKSQGVKRQEARRKERKAIQEQEREGREATS